jgi:hypothetical protein
MLWVMLVAEPDRAASAIGAARLGFDAVSARATPRYTDAMAEDEDGPRRRLPAPVDSRDAAPLLLSRGRVRSTDLAAEPLSSLLARTGTIALISGDQAGQQALPVQPGSRWDSDREALLCAWSGRQLTFEIPSELPKTIPRPVISIVDMVAPDRFPTVIADDQQSGTISRFLLVMDDASSVAPTGSGPSVDDETVAALIRVLERIDDPSPTRSRRTGNPPVGPVIAATTPKVILPGAAAASVWTGWLADNAGWRRRATGLEQEIALHWPVQAGRLALILHILWSAERDGAVYDVLPLARLRDALVLSDWLRDHALQIHATLVRSSHHTPFDDATSSDTVELTSLGELITRLARVLRDSPDTWMTRTDLARRVGSPRFAEVRSALEQMEADGIVQRHDFPTRTRISERWQLATAEPPTPT